MTLAAIIRGRALDLPRDRAAEASEFEAPSYAIREMPSPADLPRDEIGREIAILLAEHPKLADRFGVRWTNATSQESRRDLLTSIRDALGIRPIMRRTLPYVGPDISVISKKRHRVG